MTEWSEPSGIARARALVHANRLEQALEELGRLPADEAISPMAFNLRAVAFVRLDRWAEAADAARRGLAGGPDPDMFCLLGIALTAEGTYVEAERALLDGLALDPHHTMLLSRYAMLCVKVNQLDKAARLVERAAEQDPHAADVYIARVHLAFARGDDRQAQRISQEFLAAYPEEPLAHALHGHIAGKRGQVTNAYASMRQAVRHDPTDKDYAEAAIEARAYAHPLLAPLRPLYRIGPVRLWLIVVVSVLVLRGAGLTVVAGLLGLVWVAYCVYSWVVPPIVRRLSQRSFG